ncbi:MAG: prepilin-type N-terminal cleavage/methylation domain-containing protein [Planctomycetota bacterium]|nr:prepilin-type N-terminal cleavage/methylation domain-containing protein [Planctomycetota bacterium]
MRTRAPDSAAGRNRSAGSRAGFSLIELLAVLVVLGLIATMVTINWRAILPKTELHSAVRELSAILQGTRSDAIARNATFEIQYDLDEHRYRVVTPFRVSGADGVGGGLAPSNEDRAALAWHPLPKSVRFSSVSIGTDIFEKGIVVVRFDPLGSASGHVVVLSQPQDGNIYTIEVQGLLGLINYHEGLFERLPPKEDDFK